MEPSSGKRADGATGAAGLPADLGRQLRSLRRAASCSVQALAQRAGVSSGLISQVERGIGNPSLNNLQKLAAALGVSLSELFGRDASGAGPLSVRPACAVVRRDQRKQLVFPQERILYELLTPDLQRSLEVIRSVVPVDYDTSSAPYRHDGEECVHILRGRIEVHVGDEAHVLEAGDTITYDAGVPHWWRNAGDEEGEMIGATSPPSF
ncbi:MAG: cupin domain-containing protein [Candidatus Dormiibacterota bacterium]